MKLKEYKSIFKESRPFSKRVEIYIVSLYDYNIEDRIVGKWFDLTNFRDAEQLMNAIDEWLDSLNMKFNDGVVREEWAVHDSEIPQIINEESGLEDFKRFYRIKKIAEKQNIPEDVVLAYIEDNDYESGLEELVFVGKSEEDFVSELLSELKGSNIKNLVYRHINFDDTYINQLADDLADNDIKSGSTEDFDTLVDRYKKEIERDPLKYHMDILDYDIEDIMKVAWVDYRGIWEKELIHDYLSYYSKETKNVYIFRRI
jgi:hypothetical protein